VSNTSAKIPVSDIIAKMKVHSGLRVKIPSELCKKWALKDGDYVVFFYGSEGDVHLAKVGERGRFRVIQ